MQIAETDTRDTVHTTINRTSMTASSTSNDCLEMVHVDRDRHLLAALRRGGETAAECLVGLYGDRAYRLAIGITNSAQDAEEVSGETTSLVAPS